jgi:hypothetical protein
MPHDSRFKLCYFTFVKIAIFKRTALNDCYEVFFTPSYFFNFL